MKSKPKKSKSKSKSSSLKTSILFILILLVGLSLLLYPSVSNYWNSLHSSRAISSYQEAVSKIDQEKIDAMLAEAKAYNKKLFDEEQDAEGQETEEPETINTGSDADTKGLQNLHEEESPLLNVCTPSIVLPFSADTPAEENQTTPRPDTSL